MTSYTAEDLAPFLTNTTALVRLFGGGTQLVKCRQADQYKLEGCLVKPFMDKDGYLRVFVVEDQNGERTDYEKDDGHLTDGVGFFHYLDRMHKKHWSKYHFRNNDWTDMTPANWEPRDVKKQSSPAERRMKKALAA